jgi:high-affinity iron transporter
VALLVAFAIYHLGKRINIARFFTVVGALLMVFAAGILVDAVQNLQELGWVPLLTHPLWNTAHVLSENSALGDIFHSFFGYADAPTVGQLVVYVTYLALAIGGFVWVGKVNARRVRAAVAPAQGAAAVPGATGSGGAAQATASRVPPGRLVPGAPAGVNAAATVHDVR